MPSRDATRYSVYKNGLLATALEVLSVSETAGAGRLDIATLLYKDLTLEDREFNSQLVCDEIEIYDSAADDVVHWGKVGLIPPELSANTESLHVVSRAEKFHMGGQVDGCHVWNPIKPPFTEGGDIGGPELVAHPLVFNPIIDGKVQGNRNSLFTSERDPDTGDEIGYHLFLSPESVRTRAAIELQTGDSPENVAAVPWTLSQAVDYLLRTLNADELYVTNPTLETIEVVCADDEDLVLNVEIANGTYLADALDQLLEPLGYRWRLNRTALGSREFQIFGRNSGELVNVHHQRIGDSLDLGLQNVEVAGLHFDVTRLANQVKIIGGPYAYEVSVELARGWPESQDTMPNPAYYAKDGPQFLFKNAWRRWVLNESGDYIGVRSEIDGLFTSAFRTAMDDTFGPNWRNNFVPGRRRFAPTLTLDDEKQPIGPHHGMEVEYFNIKHVPPNLETGDPGNGMIEPQWKPIGNWGMSILEHECGIYFDGNFPPHMREFEVTNQADIRLRATFTLVSDKRLEATAFRQEDSPQADVLPLTIDAPTKFRYQQVSPLSKYYGSGRPSLEQINLDEINDFAERVRSIWDLMDVGGAIQLHGLDRTDSGTPYRVGQRVQAILGKNISFRAKAEAEEFPQIVAIERNATTQVMTLHLQRFSQAVNFDDGSRPRGGRRR